MGAIDDAGLRADREALLRLMRKATGRTPVMWGPGMVGFGRTGHTYDSGRSGEWSALGFSPRKASLTLHLMAGFDQHKALLGRLGKHTVPMSCLYLKRLADVDLAVLEQLVAAAYGAMRQRK